MRIKKLLFVVVAVALVSMGFLAGRALKKLGNPDSPNPPGATYSYTLEDIYNRLKYGTTGTQSTFTEPTVGPGTPTMHTLNDIMGIAPMQIGWAEATQAHVLSGWIFWGLTSGEWGYQGGTMPDNGAVHITPGTSDKTIAAGYHNGSGYVPGDTDLVAGKIKKGVNIFGVVGSYRDQDRFTDHGDGTVTDSVTKLMWLKNANCINTNYPGFDNDGTAGDGRVTWQHAFDFVAGINAGMYPNCGAGYTDWRLPEVWELFSLVDTRESNPALPDDHPFTGVQSYWYWSSTLKITGWAWSVDLDDGSVYATPPIPDYRQYVWPVRGP